MGFRKTGPNLQSRGPKIPVLKGFRTSGLKIGAPQNRQIQPRQIQPPILGPLSLTTIALSGNFGQPGQTPIGDFFSGCIVQGISGSHANSDDFPWKNPQKSIIISTNGRNTRIMMDFCGFFQGKSSEFA